MNNEQPMAAPDWEVEGVDPETREAAIMAARKAGISLAVWLNTTIRAAAAEQLKRGGGPHRYDGPEEAIWEPMPPDSPQRGEAHPPAPTAGAMFDTIQRLSARLEDVESRSLQTIKPMRDRIDRLSEEVESIKAKTGVSTAPLERAVARLSERIQGLESGPTDGKLEAQQKWSLFGRGK